MFKVKKLDKNKFIWQRFDDKGEVLEESAIFADQDECQREMNERNAWLLSRGVDPESIKSEEEVAATGVDTEKVAAEAITPKEAEQEEKPVAPKEKKVKVAKKAVVKKKGKK